VANFREEPGRAKDFGNFREVPECRAGKCLKGHDGVVKPLLIQPFLLSVLQGMEAGREACPDSMSKANAYRDTRIGRRMYFRSAYSENRL